MDTLNLTKSVANFVDIVEKSGGRPLYELTPQEARKVLLSVQADTSVPLPPAETEETSVPLDSGRTMRLQIVRPKENNQTLPIIFYIHGGGWVMGNEITHARLIRELANQTSAAVVFPIYEPSPEAQYPQTTEELFTALQYITEYGAKYNLNSDLLAVAGDSVGGNMAISMALLAKKNDNFPKILSQLLFYPVTDDNFETSSYIQFADGPWLTKKAMEWFWKQYAPKKSERKQIYACPLKADIKDLENLPQTLIITAQNDVLRDEGEAFAIALGQAGVNVSSVRINGTIHDFLMLNALANSAPTLIALRLASAFLHHTLYDNLDEFSKETISP